MKPLTSVKLSRHVSFFHFHATTDRPRTHLLYPMLRLCYYSLFTQSQPLPSSSYSWSTLRNWGTSAVLMLFWMLLNLPGSNRTSLRTYNLCSTVLLTWPNRSANGLTGKNPLCFSLTLPALKPGLPKTTPSMPTASPSSSKPIEKLTDWVIHMAPCLLTSPPIP